MRKRSTTAHRTGPVTGPPAQDLRLALGQRYAERAIQEKHEVRGRHVKEESHSVEVAIVGVPCSRRRQPARPARLRAAAPGGEDAGFTLIEVVIALALLVLLLLPVTNTFLTTINSTNGSHIKEVAVMLADTDMDQARALDATDNGGTTLYSGHTTAAVTNEWTNYDFPAVSSLLALTESNGYGAIDNTAGDPVNIPDTPQTQSVGGFKFTTYYYVGTCLVPPYQGATTTQTCGTYSTTPAPPTAGPTTGYYMFRVIVAINWNAPLAGCASSGCWYAASTLINGSSDPTFDVNPTTPWITPTSATQTITVGCVGTLSGCTSGTFSYQVATSGFPPPTLYANTSLGSCATTGSPSGVSFNTTTGILTGIPTSGTEGTYEYCFSATNTAGTGNTQTYQLTVQKASPTLVPSAPATGSVGTQVPAASITSQMTQDYNPTAKVTFYVTTSPQAQPTTGCPTGGTPSGWTKLGTVSVNGSGVSVDTTAFTPSTAGTYWWYVYYPGDTDNNATAAAGTCATGSLAQLTVPFQPTLTVSAAATATAGSPVTATSQLANAGLPTAASVSYYVYGPSSSYPTTCTTPSGGLWASVGSSAVVGSSSPGTSTAPAFTPQTAGTYWWYASFPGDTNNLAAYSTCNSASMPKTVVAVGAATTPNSPFTASSNVLAGTTTVTSGDTLLLLVYASGTSTPATPTITGTALGTLHLINTATPGTNYAEWAYWTTAGTGTSISVTFGATTNHIHLDVVQLTGNNTTAPVAQFQTNTGNSKTPTAGLSATPAAGDIEVALNGAAGNNGTPSPPTPVNGWTAISATNSSGVSTYYTASPASLGSATFGFSNTVAWATMALDIAN